MDLFKILQMIVIFTGMATNTFADKTEQIDLMVGKEKYLAAPKSTYATHPALSNNTKWSWSGPIEIVYDGRPDGVRVKATGTGQARVTCMAYYWNSNFLKWDGLYKTETVYWIITCTPNEDNNGGGGGTGGGGVYNGDKDFSCYDNITSTSEEGISMAFEIYDSNYHQNGKWPCSVMSDDPYSGKAAISKSTSGKVTIPEIVPGTKGCSVKNSFGQRTLDLDGLIVTAVNVGAFFECESITEVVIPSSVNYIGTQAFDRCTSLERITLRTSTPPKVENEKVFMQTAYNELTVWVPKGAKSAYQNANVWKKFKRIYEEGETPVYNNYDTFSAKTAEDVKITFTVTNSKDKECVVGAYYSEWNNPWFPAIDHETQGVITIPEKVNGFSVVGIAKDAFYDCQNICVVKIPNTVKSISEAAFQNCIKLYSVNIPNGVVTIAKNAFGYCKQLSSISIPNSVNSIGNRAFFNSGLNSLYISIAVR